MKATQPQEVVHTILSCCAGPTRKTLGFPAEVQTKCTTGDRDRIDHRLHFANCLEKVRDYHTTEAYKKAIGKRQVWVEPLFAEAKEWHGLRRLRLRGLLNANVQGLLIAAGQNLKSFLVARDWGRRNAPCGSLVTLPAQPGRFSAAYS